MWVVEECNTYFSVGLLNLVRRGRLIDTEQLCRLAGQPQLSASQRLQPSPRWRLEKTCDVRPANAGELKLTVKINLLVGRAAGVERVLVHGACECLVRD